VSFRCGNTAKEHLPTAGERLAGVYPNAAPENILRVETRFGARLTKEKKPVKVGQLNPMFQRRQELKVTTEGARSH
jgi:hypothetical protein